MKNTQVTMYTSLSKLRTIYYLAGVIKLRSIYLLAFVGSVVWCAEPTWNVDAEGFFRIKGVITLFMYLKA